MTKDEALKLALEALEYISSHYMSLPKIGCMALAAIEEALAEQTYPDNFIHALMYDVAKRDSEAQPEQEPVAWITKNGKGWLRWHRPEDSEKNKDSIPLYTSPPASKPWVGLSTIELDEIDAPIRERGHAAISEIYRAIEAKLKEKNT